MIFAARILWRETLRFVIPRSEATWESPATAREFAEVCLLSDIVLRDCHVGLRPPRNDKSGGLEPPNRCCNTCGCQRRSLSAATDAIGLCVLSMPCTPCKCLPEIATGAKRPRNDNSGVLAILAAAGTNRPCSAGPGCPRPYKYHPVLL